MSGYYSVEERRGTRLSKREQQVIALMAKGKSRSEICNTMGVSRDRASEYLHRAVVKRGISGNPKELASNPQAILDIVKEYGL